MWDKLTDRARKVLKIAVDVAREKGSNYVGTEDILVAIVREGSSVAANVLRELGVSDKLESTVDNLLGRIPAEAQ